MFLHRATNALWSRLSSVAAVEVKGQCGFGILTEKIYCCHDMAAFPFNVFCMLSTCCSMSEQDVVCPVVSCHVGTRW